MNSPERDCGVPLPWTAVPLFPSCLAMQLQLPLFELLPHELPPRSPEPLCAPANARIEVEGKEVLLRVVKTEKGRYSVFVRRDGQNFLLGSQSSQTPGVMLWREPPKPSKLERIGRRVHPGQENLFLPIRFAVVTNTEGVLCALSVGVRYRSNTNGTHSYSCQWFKDDLSLGFQFSFVDHGDVWQSLQQALDTPNSQANRTWRLQNMTPEERASFYKDEQAERAAEQRRNRWSGLWKRLLSLG